MADPTTVREWLSTVEWPENAPKPDAALSCHVESLRRAVWMVCANSSDPSVRRYYLSVYWAFGGHDKSEVDRDPESQNGYAAGLAILQRQKTAIVPEMPIPNTLPTEVVEIWQQRPNDYETMARKAAAFDELHQRLQKAVGELTDLLNGIERIKKGK